MRGAESSIMRVLIESVAYWMRNRQSVQGRSAGAERSDDEVGCGELARSEHRQRILFIDNKSAMAERPRERGNSKAMGHFEVKF